MTHQFKNLVFEGGGVKGIAYVGAMEVLEEEGVIAEIERVGGTSAGAINAVLFALGYTTAEQFEILKELDFRKFMDDDFGAIRDTHRLLTEFGWFKGDFFHEWISGLIAGKGYDPNSTFRDLKDAGCRDIYVYGTNLTTTYGEVFSVEHTPNERVADASRISMSIPLFFAAVRNARRDVYVDGGVLNNYPVKLFDREKYVAESDRAAMAGATEYYDSVNESFAAGHPTRSRYIFNRQTLGFRLDSAREIAAFRYGQVERKNEVEDFFDYVFALVGTVLDAQQNSHLHSDDWQRTVYIDTLGVGTTDFDLSDDKKTDLIASGRQGMLDYLHWHSNAVDLPEDHPDRPANAPSPV